MHSKRGQHLRQFVKGGDCGGTQSRAVLMPIIAIGLKSTTVSNGTFMMKGKAMMPDTVKNSV